MSKNDFRDQTLKGHWHDLKQHLERGALILVDVELDLEEVALIVSQDRVAIVQDWIAKNQLAKPLPEQIKIWNESPTKEFNFVIAQPYVLIQELAH
jgi:hypothetical protein